MSRVFAEKFNKLHLAVTKIKSLGGNESDLIEQLDQETEIISHYGKLFRDNSKFDNLLQTKIQLVQSLKDQVKLQEDINSYLEKIYASRERTILQQDYAEYETDIISEELLKNRWNNIGQEFIDAVVSILDRYGDWRYPAADLFPYNAQMFSRHMTAHEPLYIVNDKSYFKNIKDAFNPFFAENRLCLENAIEDLPSNQIGFAVCINTLEYLPLDYQGEIFKKMYKKLMHGGSFLISFNNCEFRSSLELTLSGARRYSTKEYTIGKAYSFGYDCEFTDSTNNGTWNYALLTKPGHLKSNKRSSPIVTNYYPTKLILKHDGTSEEMNRIQYEEFRLSSQARQYHQIPFDKLP